MEELSSGRFRGHADPHRENPSLAIVGQDARIPAGEFAPVLAPLARLGASPKLYSGELHEALERHPHILLELEACGCAELAEERRESMTLFVSPETWTPENAERMDRLRQSKALTFSREVFHQCQRFGLCAAHFNPFPNPDALPAVAPFEELTGYVHAAGMTASELEEVVRLASSLRLQQVVLAHEPGCLSAILSSCWPGEEGLPALSPDGSGVGYDFEGMAKANVYFAPSQLSSSGMELLNAMGMGMCVVAPGVPASREHVRHFVNGVRVDKLGLRAS